MQFAGIDNKADVKGLLIDQRIDKKFSPGQETERGCHPVPVVGHDILAQTP